VAGHSCGAPFALAIAYRLRDRVGKIVLASPIAPLDEDWGFEPEDVSHHVELFCGDADDILDPKMPKQLADRLPECTFHVWSDTGHYGFVERERWIDFLTAVR